MATNPIDFPKVSRNKPDKNITRFVKRRSTRHGRGIEKTVDIDSINGKTVGFVVRIFFIITLVILFISILWRVRGGQTNLTFTGFLDWLSNLNYVDIDLSFVNMRIGGDWGWFDFMRNFLNIFASVFGVICWLFGNLLNVCLYVLDFLRFLFIG